jgi:hypothetical protein
MIRGLVIKALYEKPLFVQSLLVNPSYFGYSQ